MLSDDQVGASELNALLEQQEQFALERVNQSEEVAIGRERLGSLGKVINNVQNITRGVLSEIKGDLLAPSLYPFKLGLNKTRHILAGYAIEFGLLSEAPVINGFYTGSAENAIAMWMVNYVAVGIVMNHPEEADRIASKLLGCKNSQELLSAPVKA